MPREECCQVMGRRGGTHILEDMGFVIQYLITRPINPPPAEACCDVESMRNELWAGLCETRRVGYADMADADDCE